MLQKKTTNQNPFRMNAKVIGKWKKTKFLDRLFKWFVWIFFLVLPFEFTNRMDLVFFFLLQDSFNNNDNNCVTTENRNVYFFYMLLFPNIPTLFKQTNKQNTTWQSRNVLGLISEHVNLSFIFIFFSLQEMSSLFPIYFIFFWCQIYIFGSVTISKSRIHMTIIIYIYNMWVTRKIYSNFNC